MITQYYLTRILDSKNEGWLKVIIKNEGLKKLPFSTKIKLIRREKKFEVVKILEGSLKNKIAFMPYLNEDSDNYYSYLDKNLIYQKSKIKIIKGKNRLYINDKSYECIINTKNLNKGRYFIDFPILTTKNINQDYLNESRGGSRFAKTWFPFFSKEEIFIENYIHFGTYSDGCITIPYEYNREGASVWNEIYFSIITSRINDKLSCLDVV